MQKRRRAALKHVVYNPQEALQEAHSGLKFIIFWSKQAHLPAVIQMDRESMQ